MLQSIKLAFVRGRSPRTAGSIFLALVSVTTQMTALMAVTGALSTSSAPGTSGAAMGGALSQGIACRVSASLCHTAPTALAGDSQAEKIVVPKGAAQCPNSGAGAACSQGIVASQPGVASLPDGQAACPDAPDKLSLGAPGVCSDAPAPPIAGLAGGSPAAITPDQPTVTLAIDHSFLAAGQSAFLEARSNLSMTGTPWSLEIFDMSAPRLLAACSTSTTCSIQYSGKTGKRSFSAFVMTPGPSVPVGTAAATSNQIDARWLGVDIAVGGPSIAAPGKPITFTATATEDVGTIGYRIELRDAVSGQRLTFCSEGTVCSTSLVEPAARTRTVVAQLVPQAPASHATAWSLNPSSGNASGTWLGVDLASSNTASASGGTISLTATANADLSHTPWSIYFQNEAGQLLGKPCKTSTCAVSINVGANDNTRYRAIIAGGSATDQKRGPIGAVLRGLPGSADALQVQAASQLVKPPHFLWGVDSCKPMTTDPTGSSGLLPQVISGLGNPDFWGRYLPSTTYCPGLSSAEIAAAHAHHVGILPIYNNYDCSAVVGYPAGASYGEAAAALAVADGIPSGTGIAIDIEPPGDACPGAANVDSGFVQGWYDVITHYKYVPVFYGNSTFGSEFAAAWCAAVTTRPEIARTSSVWSFEPSLQNGPNRSAAPAFGPNQAGCAGYTLVWQYQLSAGSAPDVDVDEAYSVFPFWYP